MTAPAPQDKRHFHWKTFIVVAALVAVLVWAAIPQITICVIGGPVLRTVSNGRQIFLASFNMAQDALQSGDPLLGWPGELAFSAANPVTDLPAFVERLVQFDYVKRSDVGQLFAAPEVPTYSGAGKFTGTNSAFKVYLVTGTDVNNTVFLGTKNFTFNRGLDAAAVPYGDKDFVMVRKGGDAVSLHKQQALDPNIIGYMPGHHTAEDPGVETGKNVWKD